MKYLLFATLLAFFTSCEPKNPHPELSDEIYKDLLVEKDIAAKALEAEIKNLNSLIKEKAQAVPQTGQIKYANKRINDAQAAVNKLAQQKLYFEIKIEQRIQHAQQMYAASLKPGGRPWPDAEEVGLYKSITKFQREKINWEKTKGVKKNVPRGTETKAAPPAHSEH